MKKLKRTKILNNNRNNINLNDDDIKIVELGGGIITISVPDKITIEAKEFCFYLKAMITNHKNLRRMGGA